MAESQRYHGGMNVVTESQNPKFSEKKTIHVLFTEATVGWVFILLELKHLSNTDNICTFVLFFNHVSIS